MSVIQKVYINQLAMCRKVNYSPPVSSVRFFGSFQKVTTYIFVYETNPDPSVVPVAF